MKTFGEYLMESVDSDAKERVRKAVGGDIARYEKLLDKIGADIERLKKIGGTIQAKTMKTLKVHKGPMVNLAFGSGHGIDYGWARSLEIISAPNGMVNGYNLCKRELEYTKENSGVV